MQTVNINNHIINIIFVAILFTNGSVPGLLNDTTNIYDKHNRPDKSNNTFIEWREDSKLLQSDFKAKIHESPGSTVATTASAFGFSITDYNGDISGSIYVRFYPSQSWWNPEYSNDENVENVLKHEQLHFDICELYGRKLFKGILGLRGNGRLNERNINKLLSKLEKEYSNYQDKYDLETEHSINRPEQVKWNSRIKKELVSMKWYSNYHSF